MLDLLPLHIWVWVSVMLACLVIIGTLSAAFVALWVYQAMTEKHLAPTEPKGVPCEPTDQEVQEVET